ncbi:MAG: hypothetical protein QW103_00085 [Candidatus Pacearchaeota archaeon]
MKKNKIVDFFTNDYNLFNYICKNSQKIAVGNTSYFFPSYEEGVNHFSIFFLNFKGLEKLINKSINWYTEYEIRDSSNGDILKVRKLSNNYLEINEFKGEKWFSA